MFSLAFFDFVFYCNINYHISLNTTLHINDSILSINKYPELFKNSCQVPNMLKNHSFQTNEVLYVVHVNNPQPR